MITTCIYIYILAFVHFCKIEVILLALPLAHIFNFIPMCSQLSIILTVNLDKNQKTK